MHADAKSEADKLANLLTDYFELMDIPIIDLPPAIVVHGGPGILALSFLSMGDRMALPALLSRWRAEPSVSENIIMWETIPSQLAKTVPLPETLHPALLAAVRSHGLRSLYTHQNQAWRAVLDGRNIVLCTGTASGKSLAYNLPVIDRLLKDPGTHALYIFQPKP